MRYKIEFSYDGTDFNGYQIQPNLRTIQNELEKAVSYLNGQTKTEVVASGRTDKGVHALGQIAHFDLIKDIPLYKIKRGLNTLLPDDIHIISVEKVSSSFHARYMATSKEYSYFINMGEYDPLNRNYCYQLDKDLDLNLMKQASRLFIGKHDFRSFIDSEDIRENTVREIYTIDFIKKEKILIIKFNGNGFMKYQVRNMVGALVLVGLHRKTLEDLEILMNSKSREKAWKAVPTCGLYLEKVNY